ncbi:phage major capsid protein, P2 family [Sphingomonas sp. BK069]|uniref:phage major capsid protein, P2 family n=1 Tax=Sphingomonas sp. BK069 TaxID=2586979 RepID=UPI0016215831|nr:phage major capsid protein, P2 family [Sphingomonas sp. BK069]MBB3346065.1 P2 family phage major capsid protein [Sphingomonas sp. BK069]
MRNETRAVFNTMLARIAQLNGIDASVVAAQHEFAVAPVVQQKLEEVIQQSSEFLGRVNVVTVKEQEGAKVGVGVTRPLASRTRTDSATGVRRRPIDPTETSDRGRYRCEQTNSDTAISYAKLDMWAHRPEFQTLYASTIAKQRGRDRIMIGWNGVARADTTDLAAHPLLQDVNYGWLHKLRTYAPARHLAGGHLDKEARDGTGVVTAPGKIHVAAGTPGVDVDYVNLDALVYDATELLDEWHRDDTDLVVILGRELVHDRFLNVINTAGDKATEMEARDRILTLPKQVGGKTAILVPFFPANALMVTSLDNLSIYVQEGTQRRALREEPEYDQVADYQSVNEAYVIEDYGRCALVENIVTAKK